MQGQQQGGLLSNTLSDKDWVHVRKMVKLGTKRWRRDKKLDCWDYFFEKLEELVAASPEPVFGAEESKYLI